MATLFIITETKHSNYQRITMTVSTSIN